MFGERASALLREIAFATADNIPQYNVTACPAKVLLKLFVAVLERMLAIRPAQPSPNVSGWKQP